jgi:hypothetical protein
MAHRVLPSASPAGKSRSSTTDLHHSKVTAACSDVSMTDVENLRLIQSELAAMADTDQHSSGAAAKYRLLSEALGNVTNAIVREHGIKRSFPGVAPSHEAYANKRQKNQEAREDALTRAVVPSSTDLDTAWSRITVLAQARPNQEAREDALTRAPASPEAAWSRISVQAQARKNREGREEALSRITMLTLRPHNTKATNAVVRNNTTRPKRLYTQVTTTAAQSPRLEQLCYPLPTNGSFYLPLEVVRILETVDRKLRGATILEWIQKKLVPVGRSAVYECVSNAKKGRPISPNWNMKGQKALLTIAEIKEVGNSLRILRGSSFTKKDAEAAFTKKHHENMVSQGLMPIGKSSVLSATTITNYMAILARSGTSTLG